jgi:hypothetical protein
MWVKVPTAAFRSVLGLVGSLSRGMRELESSSDIMLTAEEGNSRLVVEAFVSGIYVKVGIPAQVEVEGSVSTALSFVAGLKLAGDSVSFRFDTSRSTSQMIVQSGKFKVFISVGAADPVADKRPLSIIDLTCSIPATLLYNGLHSVLFKPQDAARLYGTFAAEENSFALYAHDNYRAAVYTHKNLAADSNPFSVSLPLDVLSKITSAVKQKKSDDDVVVKLGTDGKMVRIRAGIFEVYHPVLDLDVEDVRERMSDIVGDSNGHTALSFDPKMAAESVASLLSVPKGKADQLFLKMALKKEESIVALRLKSSLSEGISKFNVDVLNCADDYTGATISAPILADVLSMLKTLGGDSIKISFIDDYIVIGCATEAGDTSHFFSQVEE